VPALAGDAPLAAAVKTAFLRIDTDGLATLIVPYVALKAKLVDQASAMVGAELGLAWGDVVVDQHLIGKTGLHVRRMTIADLDRESERSLGILAATACAQLIGAAAEQWSIACADCRAEGGAILDNSGRRSATFAQLAQDAALQDLPAAIRLRSGIQCMLLRRNELM
jgi:isoquinoline 1-oxidoreductase beta subunit